MVEEDTEAVLGDPPALPDETWARMLAAAYAAPPMDATALLPPEDPDAAVVSTESGSPEDTGDVDAGDSRGHDDLDPQGGAAGHSSGAADPPGHPHAQHDATPWDGDLG